MVVLHNDDFGAHYDVADDLLLFFVLGFFVLLSA